MGKKSIKKPGADNKGKKRGKKKKTATSPIEDALACPPNARFFHELVANQRQEPRRLSQQREWFANFFAD